VGRGGGATERHSRFTSSMKFRWAGQRTSGATGFSGNALSACLALSSRTKSLFDWYPEQNLLLARRLLEVAVI